MRHERDARQGSRGAGTALRPRHGRLPAQQRWITSEGTRTSTLLIVSTQRDELHQLIDELPEEQVADALAMLRARKSRGRRDWPPRWFGAVQAGRSDTAQRAEEILRDGFGRSA
jgi:hypothetical protein